MFEITIVVIGRLKSDFQYLVPGIEDYQKRMRPYARVTFVEVADEAITTGQSTAQIQDKEAQRLFPLMEKAGRVIALSERGKALDSLAFAETLGQWLNTQNPPNRGRSHGTLGTMMFLVGGPLGLSNQVLDRSDDVISLSPLTFPHPMVRLILVEQLYRAFRILRNEPYHK